MQACPRCARVIEGDFAFCPHCGAELAPGAELEQRKTVTALFCDITGSTSLGESLDPEALRALLGRYFDRMSAIVEAHGGVVEKFIGDAVVAFFGVPRAHEDDALRAVGAAIAMREALPDVGVKARIGVNTGEVVTGMPESLMTGDAVNVAARLEQVAEPNEVLIGESTFALVRRAVDVEPVEPLILKGKSQSVPAYRLLSVGETPERGHEAIFIGRRRELGLLREAWERARSEQRCELVSVVGDAGVGKSRLAAEFHAQVEAEVVRGRCLPYGEGITYWPVVEVLKQLAVLPPEPAAAAAIQSLLGESDAVTSADEIAWGFRKTLERAAAERPLVVVFDDIHGGEQAFLDLIEHVSLFSSGFPILLLCLARPELSERRPGWPVTLRLEPLADDDVEQLIGERLLPGLREKLARAAGGNPLFVHEMLAMVGEADVELTVPPSLRALLAARLDQLEATERGVLERGAVEGELFHRGAVQALAAGGQVTPRLAALVRKGLIRPDRPRLSGEDAFRFRHLLIRDAAYASLPKRVRAELHERFAAWLVEHGAELVELDEFVGHHLEQAYRYREVLGPVADDERRLGQAAAERLGRAARRALNLGHAPAAAGLLERATSLLPSEDPIRAELLLVLGEAIEAVGDSPRAVAVADEAARAAAVIGDGVLRARAKVVGLLLRMRTDTAGAVAEARAVAAQAVPVFEACGDAGGLAKSWRLLGWISFLDAHASETEEALERAVAYGREAGDRWEESENLSYLAENCWRGPRPIEQALIRCDEILAQSTGDRRLQAMVALHRAVLEAWRGRFDDARVLLAEARASLEDLGLESDLYASFFAGEIELAAGNPAAAESEVRPALDKGPEDGMLAVELGQAVYQLGRLGEARVLADCAERKATHLADRIAAHGLSAKLLARAGHMLEAEAAAREAVELAQRSDYLQIQANALMDLAEVLRLATRTDDAAASIAAALRLYEQKGSTAFAAHAEALLNALTSATPPSGTPEQVG
jgi:class 3 adenylate cyclase/tetratricopeptide (TPR) repeat protein